MADNDTLNGRAPVEVTAHIGDFTLTAEQTGTAHTNTGAGGATICTLPAATPGLRFEFCIGAAQELKLQPAGQNQMCATATGVPGTATKYLSADAIGESVEIVCYLTGIWSFRSAFGTWTVQS